MRYFPDLTDAQRRRFEHLQALYGFWNARINVISRRDLNYLYERHVLHSLAIARFCTWVPGTQVVDVGTGGGFPGIPLAIYFPEVHFTLVDSVQKKIHVVQSIISELTLSNASAVAMRAEELKQRFDFVTARAVADLKQLYQWTRHLVNPQGFNSIANGWLLLKGGHLEDEIRRSRLPVIPIPLSRYFTESFFAGKFLLYVPCASDQSETPSDAHHTPERDGSAFPDGGPGRNRKIGS